MNQRQMQMPRLKKLFGAAHKDALRKTTLTNPLLEQKLARLSCSKREIQSWESNRERILSDLEQRQQTLKAEMSQLQEIEDPVKKRYMMKSLLQQWRDNDLTLDCQQQEMNTRITALAAQCNHELAVLTAHTPGLVNGDKTELVHGCVLLVIEALIGIYERLEDSRVKPELARAISELIATTAALDARSVHSNAQIVHFQKESAFLRNGGAGLPQKIMNRHALRPQSPARHQQPHRSLDE
ncbi:MAG: hypothetical protein JW945_01380 [Methanomicrobia archaeon]|nr:hypothetical protein [Methanomicrobia archaeon]